MTTLEILNHLVNTCVRNEDGSLSLGTYEVDLLVNALEQLKKE